MKDYKPIISKNILELRQKKGMTQAELAGLLHYSDKAVSKWERGESLPEFAVIAEIADIFGVSIDYLAESEHPVKNAAPAMEPTASDVVSQARKGDAGDVCPEILSESAVQAAGQPVPVCPDTGGADAFPCTDTGSSKTNENAPAGDTAPSGSVIKKTINGDIIKQRSNHFKRSFITITCILFLWLFAILTVSIIRSTVHSNRWDWLIFVYAVPCSIVIWLVFNSVWFNKHRNYLIISILIWTVLFAIYMTLLRAGFNIWIAFLPGIPTQIIIYLWSKLSLRSLNKDSAVEEHEDKRN